MKRLDSLFAQLKKEERAGLAIFTTACDPTYEGSLEIVQGLEAQGVDLIELGMPFSDPTAEGATIQASSQRAIAAGATMDKTFALVRAVREKNQTTPIILMGYYNPILAYGLAAWATAASMAGVDGVIIVDCPPEEEEPLRDAMAGGDLVIVRLISPTSEKRLPLLLKNAEGFLYYVSITGTTGAARPDFAAVAKQLQPLQRQTNLPIALGFGIQTPEDSKAAAALADLVVIGSAFVALVATGAPTADFITAHQKAIASVKKT